MIRVLTPIGIALFFISYPPFHRLLRFKSRSCFDACDISRSFSSAVTHDQRHSRRLAVRSALCLPQPKIKCPGPNSRHPKPETKPPFSTHPVPPCLPSGPWAQATPPPTP